MSLPLKPDCLWAVYGTDNGRHFVNQSAVPNSENLLLGLTVATSILFLKQTNKNIIRLHVQFLERNPTKLARISVSPPSSKGPLGLLLSPESSPVQVVAGEGVADYQGKHKRREQNTMTRPRSKTTLQCSQVRLASSRGYFSSAAPSGASGSGVGAPVCREPRASTSRPTPDHRGRGHLLHPPSARAPPPRPRPLRWAPQGEVCTARTHAKSTISRTMVARPRTPPPTPPGRCRWTSSLPPTSKPLLRLRQRAETAADFLRELRPFSAKMHPPPETTDGPVNQSKLGTGGPSGQTASRANPYARQRGRGSRNRATPRRCFRWRGGGEGNFPRVPSSSLSSRGGRGGSSGRGGGWGPLRIG